MAHIKYKVTLTPQERTQLYEIATRGHHNSQTILNAVILLRCDEGPGQDQPLTNQAITDVLPISMKKIDRVKQRFVEHGLDAALVKQPARRLYPRKVDGEVEAHLVALSCSQPPSGHARWSLRLLADQMVELQYTEAISHETVRRVLKKTS